MLQARTQQIRYRYSLIIERANRAKAGSGLIYFSIAIPGGRGQLSPCIRELGKNITVG